MYFDTEITFIVGLSIANVREQSKTAGTLDKLLLGGLTVHSIFQLLLDSAVYLRMGELLKRCEHIVWNESTRAHKKQ